MRNRRVSMCRNAFTCSVLGQIGADTAMNHAMRLQHICRHRRVHDIALRGIFDDFNMQDVSQAHEAPLSGNKRNAAHTSAATNAMLSPTRRFRPDTPFADLARIHSLCELSKSTKKIDIDSQGCIGDTTGPQYSRASKPKPQPRAASWQFPNARYSYSRFLLAFWRALASPRFTASVTNIPVTIGK